MTSIFAALLLSVLPSCPSLPVGQDASFYEAYYLVHAKQDQVGAASLLKSYLASGTGSKVSEARELLAQLKVDQEPPASDPQIKSLPLNLGTLFPVDQANDEVTKAYRNRNDSERELAAGHPFEAARLRTRYICWGASQLRLNGAAQLDGQLQALESELKIAQRVGNEKSVADIQKGMKRIDSERARMRSKGWKAQIDESAKRLRPADDFLFLLVDLQWKDQLDELPSEMQKDLLDLRTQRRVNYHASILRTSERIRGWKQTSSETERIDALLSQLELLEAALAEKDYDAAQHLANEAFRFAVN